ncbi:mitotic spindle assembly checkpoint protein MAD1 [Patella vulgata]|uniref:mitotic spindle assembly checkpoint protein MAD1 n=1 Tax=Patella vulgata TaxID=6465 RepID=UPI0024A83A78|nr:mitotic spindle assembly checkpoint protein MAD1 [Patella vulgata]
MDDETMDNTAVIRMKRELDAYLSDSASIVTNVFRESRPRTSLFFQNDLTTTPDAGDPRRERCDNMGSNEIDKDEMICAKPFTRPISDLETKRVRLDLEKEVEILKEEKKVLAEKYADLQLKLKFVCENEQSLKEQLKVSETDFAKCKSSKEDILRYGQKTRWKLEEALKESSRRISDQNFKINELQSRNNRPNIEAVKAQRKLEFHIDQLRIMSSQIEELEKFKDQAIQGEVRIRELENQLAKHQDEIVITRVCKSKLDTVPELEKQRDRLIEENNELKVNERNFMKLEEEFEGLQKKLARSEERVYELNRLDIVNEEMRQIKQRCKLCGSSESQSRATMLKQISDLKATHMKQLEEQGELSSRLRRSENQLLEFQTKYQSTQEKLNSTNTNCQKQADFIKRLQKKLLLTTKEKEGYKRIIESYESEVTLNVANPGIDRTQQLEDIVQSYKRHCETLETENNQQLEQIADLKQKCQHNQSGGHTMSMIEIPNVSKTSDLDVIAELKEKIINLETLLKQTQEEKYTLECRIEQSHLQGNYDPTKTKIVHFTMNPAAKAQQQREQDLEVLRSENEKLRGRLNILENAKGECVEDLTLRVEEKLQNPSPNKQVEDMKAQVRKEELRNRRLMEAFKKTSQEFRNVCCQLLGYKIDITGNSQYRLTSIYSESVHDHLIFQQSSTGDIQLMDTEFSQTVQDLIDNYLVKQDSVPAFLSSVCLDLFRRQTINLG